MAFSCDRLPLVSVLVFLHGSEETARASIESCLGQRYRNVEIIVVDDCSNPPLSALARDYEPSVRIVRVPQDISSSVGRNVALSHASGDFVLFHDTEDLLFPGRFRYELEASREARADIVVSMNRWFRDGESIRYDTEPMCRRERRLLRHITNIAGATEDALTSMLQYGTLPQSCVLYRTSVVRALGGYMSGSRPYAERELLFRAICRGATVAAHTQVTSARRFQELPTSASQAVRPDDVVHELALATRYTLALERAGMLVREPLRQALIAYVTDRVCENAKHIQNPELAGAALDLIARIDSAAATTGAAEARNPDSRANKAQETSRIHHGA